MIRKIKGYFSRSYKRKIQTLLYSAIVLLSLLLATLSYFGIDKLYRTSSNEMDMELKSLNEEYLENRIEITSTLIDYKISRFYEEIFTLADIYQNFIDKKSELSLLLKSIEESKILNNELYYNGKWSQNKSGGGSVLLVPGYMSDKDGNIRSDVKEDIVETSILDLIMPSFYKNGPKKMWLYYEGPRDGEIIRATPWQDIGSVLYGIYPKYIERPLWDEFNPGLVDMWEERIKQSEDDLDSMAIMKNPYQDGGTGQIVTTINYPVWDKNREKFNGAINVDIPLSEITSYVEDANVGKNGFAYISQPDGNVFALNDYGAKVLGLSSMENIRMENDGSNGYNPMQRYFSESRYESVQNIDFPESDEVYFKEIRIKSKDYVLVQKLISPINFWNMEEGYHKERWILGFVIPKDELYFVSLNMSGQIEKSRDAIFISQLLTGVLLTILIGFLAKLMIDKLTMELKKLETFAEEITNKNYDYEVDIASNDEIGKLSRAFENMIAEIKSTLKKLQDQNEELMMEIKNRKMHQEEIRYLTEYDFLTDLPKEKLFVDTLESSLRSDGNGLVVLIGLDDFKNINKVFGYTGGNNILNLVARKIKERAPENSIISRISGDEFAILYENMNSREEMIINLESLQSIFLHPVRIDEKDIFISASMGISVYPKDSSSSIDLLRFASSALFQAKKFGKGSYAFYDKNAHQMDEKRITLINSLKTAILNDEFKLVFQPQVNMVKNKVEGFEALLRWKNENFGIIPPNIFIPLAEEIGMIGEIGRWVLKKACMFGLNINEQGYEDINMAVNISAVQFNQNDLIEDVMDAINSSGFNPENLELEVTESFFINNMEYVSEILKEIRKRGIKVAVDDFGTGYSSLSYIKDIPTDKLKIDRSFIKDYPEGDNGSIASVIIHLAKNLGIKTIAEGVETEEQKEYLMKNGCDSIQGYFYSKPLDMEDVVEFLKSFNSNE